MATAFAIIPKRYANYYDVPQQFQPRLVQRQVIGDPPIIGTTTTAAATTTTTQPSTAPDSTTTTAAE